MPRIDRRLRAKPPQVRGLWPPPLTLESCEAAVERASIEELVQARDRLARVSKKDEAQAPFAYGDLGFGIDRELKLRFRSALAAGLSRMEAERWAELLCDPVYVESSIAYKTKREAEEKRRRALPQHRVLDWRAIAKN